MRRALLQPLPRSLSPDGQTLVREADKKYVLAQCLLASGQSSSGGVFAIPSTCSNPASTARDNAGRHVVRELRTGQERNVGAQWIVTPRPNPRAAIRLICSPPAGGGMSTAPFSLHILAGDATYLQREREAVTALIANQLSVMVSALARWFAIR